MSKEMLIQENSGADDGANEVLRKDNQTENNSDVEEESKDSDDEEDSEKGEESGDDHEDADDDYDANLHAYLATLIKGQKKRARGPDAIILQLHVSKMRCLNLFCHLKRGKVKREEDLLHNHR